MRDSILWHTVFCPLPLLKPQGFFREISLCGYRKLARQGHLRGSMTRGLASVATKPMLQPGTWATIFESNWRYLRHDVVDCAGATQSISLEVLVQYLIQYLSIRSKKHANKILCPNTGAHIFPSEATYIPSKIWKMELFQGCRKGESFGEAITRFRASGMTMKLA